MKKIFFVIPALAMIFASCDKFTPLSDDGYTIGADEITAVKGTKGDGYKIRSTLNAIITAHSYSNLGAEYYWSSTENKINTYNAFYVDFRDGSSDQDPKTSTYYVRAV